MYAYTPNVTDRSGELLGAGIMSGARSLADAISQYGAMRDEAAGYQKIVKALAQDPNSGIDPDSVDKMSIWDAKNTVLGAHVRQQIAERQQQNSALSNFLSTMGNAMPNTGAPSPDLSAALTGDGSVPVRTSPFLPALPAPRGPLASPPMTAGPSAIKLAILSASKDPAVLQTQIGRAHV